MAFATSNVRSDTLGNIKVLAGNWSGVAGDADGTIVVGGGQIYDATFRDGGASSPVDILYCTNTAVSGTSYTTTITIPNRETVTRGTFIIFYA